ncbi:hypothetical protein D3C71_1241360 [compost metagenome]
MSGGSAYEPSDIEALMIAVPWLPCAMPASSRSISRVLEITSAAQRYTRSPPSVSAMLRPARRTRGYPSLASMPRRCAVTTGCAMHRRSAARVTLRRSATQQKTSNFWKVR